MFILLLLNGCCCGRCAPLEQESFATVPLTLSEVKKLAAAPDGASRTKAAKLVLTKAGASR